MLISQPLITAENPILAVTYKIAGLDISTFTLLVLIIGIFAFLFFKYWWDARKRNKNIKLAKQCVLLEICPNDGSPVKKELCKSYKGEAKQVSDQSRGTFLISLFAKPPEGTISEPYQLWPGYGHIDVWPLDAPASQQIPIQKFYFIENDPAPKIPQDASRYSEARIKEITTTFARLSREEAIAQTMLGQFSGFFDSLIAALPALKRIPLIFLLILGIIALLAVNLYFGFHNGQLIEALQKVK